MFKNTILFLYTMDNITFYKFVEINNLSELRENILNLCIKHEIKGKILIAKEGISGYCSGNEKATKEFIEYMHNIEQFRDLWFKHNKTEKENSKKMLVKIRNEIITFKQEYNIKNTGKYLKPEELDKLYQSKEDFIIIDIRNDYECEQGQFKNAIRINSKEFTQFPEEILKLKEQSIGKKVIAYCTGGVRCEKATAWMNENGFDDVYQLDGGIINYGIERGQGNWEGKCFVFDDRGAIEIDPKKQDIKYNQCSICFVPCEKNQTCRICGKEYLMCTDCNPLIENTCSKFCRNLEKMKEEKIRTNKEYQELKSQKVLN
jgi:UPF0176 protein